jgi:hydrogenase large subunit
MSNRVVVDPITRIEGHLRIEAQMQGDRIEKAYSSGTMVRGIEIIMRGRDPRDAWAFTQRICGVCTLVHGMASIRAVEDALKYEIPPNAQLIRNLMIGAQFVHDHVMHFYHLHALDWVDVVSALSADAAATAELAKAVSPSWPKSSEGYFRDVKKKLQTFVEGGQLGIFANAYWGHPAYKLPAEANLMAVAHYLEALAWQRDAAKLHTIFGGRNPHPNFVVGGVPCPIDLNSDSAINAERLSMVQNIITMMKDIRRPGVRARHAGHRRLLQGLVHPRRGPRQLPVLRRHAFQDSQRPRQLPVPARRDPQPEHQRSPRDRPRRPRTRYPGVRLAFLVRVLGRQGPGPASLGGRDQVRLRRPRRPAAALQAAQRRGRLQLAQVAALEGPFHGGRPAGPRPGQLRQRPRADARAGQLHAADPGRPGRAVFSTLGRTAARTLETKIVADAMQGWLDQLTANIRGGDTKTFNEILWDPSSWPKTSKGVGFHEAPRGGLTHWIVIENGRIDNYQAVVPTTWNAGPRDPKGVPGAYEAALQDNHQLYDPEQPIEILRTIHSFDPCLACAVHVTDPDGKELIRVKAL